MSKQRTPPPLEAIAALSKAGLRSKDIALIVGMTASAIRSIWHRNPWMERNESIVKPVDPAPPVVEVVVEPPPAPDEAVVNAPVLIGLSSTRCRWPLWSDRAPQPDRTFVCGEPCLKQYCEKHMAVAYRPVPKRSGKVIARAW